jgi:hypothetical protein
MAAMPAAGSGAAAAAATSGGVAAAAAGSKAGAGKGGSTAALESYEVFKMFAADDDSLDYSGPWRSRYTVICLSYHHVLLHP